MSEDTASDLVAELGEKATDRPWHSEMDYVAAQVAGGRPNGEIIGRFQPSVARLISRAESEANAAYTALAVNSLPLLLKALEEVADEPLPPIREMTEEALICRLEYLQGRAAQALATVRDAAQKALKED